MLDLDQKKLSLLMESLSAHAKKARKGTADLAVGGYGLEGEVTLQINHKIVQRAPTLAKPSVAIPYTKVMALLIHRLGIQREKAIELIQEAFEEAMIDGTAVGETEVLDKTVNDFMKLRVDQIIESLPKLPRAGQIAVTGDVRIVNAQLQTAEVANV